MEQTYIPEQIMLSAVNAFGIDHQTDKCLEELGELATALIQYRQGRIGLDVLLGELADVQVTTGQLRLHYGATSVDQIVAVKLARLSRLVANQVAANTEKAKPVKPVLRWEPFLDDELDLYVNNRREVSVLQPGGHLWRCTAPTIPAWFPTRLQAMRAAEALLGLPEVPLWTP